MGPEAPVPDRLQAVLKPAPVSAGATLAAWAGDGGARYLALATRRADGFYRALGYAESAVFFRKPLD